MAYKRSKTNLKILVTLQSLAFGSRSDWINFHMISFVMGIMHHTILFFFGSIPFEIYPFLQSRTEAQLDVRG